MKQMPPVPEHVYHLLEAVNWPSIQEHGLLSACTLLQRHGLPVEGAGELVMTQRPGLVPLSPEVTLRDQLPMPPGALARCLVGMTPGEWYQLLNQRVFFWWGQERLERHLHACSGRPQVLLTLPTAPLLEQYGAQASVTPINTGNARRHPARRGRATFVAYQEWLAQGWRSEAEALGTPLRPRRHPPAELTILHGVPNAMALVQKVEHVVGRTRRRVSAGTIRA